MALWPVIGMLDRISEHTVTICMLGSYDWNNNASKICSHTHTLVHTTKEIYREVSCIVAVAAASACASQWDA